jgi:aminocarboxymuconate-semialdehyde decarboxylase
MTPTVDFHGHFLPRGAIAAAASGTDWYDATVRRDANDIPVIGIGRRTHSMASDRYWDPWDERLERLSAVGIDVQVLSLAPNIYRYELPAAAAISMTREVNDEVLAVSADSGGRFRGLAALPMQSPDDAVRELERTVAGGLIGASVGTHVEGVDWDHPSLDDVLAAADELGALLFLHPVHPRLRRAEATHHLGNVIGNPMETTIAAFSMLMGGVFKRHPGLKVLLSHAGGFVNADIGRLAHAASVRAGLRESDQSLIQSVGHFHYDCIAHDHGQLRSLVERVGIGQVVLGTDYPADMGIIDPLAWLRAGGFTEDEISSIATDNAVPLLTTRGGGR